MLFILKAKELFVLVARLGCLNANQKIRAKTPFTNMLQINDNTNGGNSCQVISDVCRLCLCGMIMHAPIKVCSWLTGRELASVVLKEVFSSFVSIATSLE